MPWEAVPDGIPHPAASQTKPFQPTATLLPPAFLHWGYVKVEESKVQALLYQQGKAMPKRETIAYGKGTAELKQIKYAKEEGPTQKLRWLCSAIRKDKVILLSLFFLLLAGMQKRLAALLWVCRHNSDCLRWLQRGGDDCENSFHLQDAPTDQLKGYWFLAPRKQLVPMCIEYMLYLAGNFNSMGRIPVIIMTILDWHNCENCQVVLHSHCHL